MHHRYVTDQKLRCLFCYEESGDNIVASSEHLLSRPVARAFGIERQSPVARMGVQADTLTWAALGGIKRRCVCTSCNNGWMNRLEGRMTGIAAWLTGPGDQPLGAERALDLRKWALKTHLLLCFIEGNAGRFGDETFSGECVVPPVTPAKALFRDDTAMICDSTVGVSRSDAATRFAWSFGFPGVTARGGVKGHPRFAPVSVVTVGDLQLWTAVPLLPARVTTPGGVRDCHTGLRPRDLATTGHPMSFDIVRVDFD